MMLWFLLSIFFYLHNTQGWFHGKPFGIVRVNNFQLISSCHLMWELRPIMIFVVPNFFLYFRMRKYCFSLIKNKISCMWACVFHANIFHNNTCGSIKLTVRISVFMFWTFKFIRNHLLYSTKFAKVYVRDPANRTVVYEVNLLVQNG